MHQSEAVSWWPRNTMVTSGFFRLSAAFLFAVSCTAEQNFAPADVFSIRVRSPLVFIRLFNLITVIGLFAGCRYLGQRVLKYCRWTLPAGGIEVGISTTLGIALLSTFVHLPAAFGLMRFHVVAPFLVLLVFLGADSLRDDLIGISDGVRRFSRLEVLAAGLLFLLLVPPLWKAALPLFHGDELMMYLPLLRGFAEQGSFAPVPWTQMVNTFSSSGFSLMALGYVLGGDGVSIFISFGYLLILMTGLHGFAKTFGLSRSPVLSLVIFAFLLQVVVAGQINFPSFVDDGMGYSKLHAITSLFLFESVVVLILYLQAPDLKKGICLSILLSFLGGIQLLGLVVLVALGAALLIQGVRLHWKTAGLSLALTVPWYLKTWFQVGCPFPAGIAPFWLTNLFLSNPKFYPRFYHHHFIYLFQFENEALSRVRVPFQGLANLMAQSPFNLLLPASLFLWAVRFPGMDKKGNRNFLFAAYLVLAALILNHPNPRYFIYFFPFLAVCFLALAEASSAFLRRFVKTKVSLSVLSFIILFSTATVSQAFAIPYTRVFPFYFEPAVAPVFLALPFVGMERFTSKISRILDPRYLRTPLWVRQNLPSDARILHNSLHRWYFADRPTFQMDTTLGGAAFQPSARNMIKELNAAGITHFFFALTPFRFTRDQFRFYSPLFEHDVFRRHFKLVFSNEEGLLFRFFPERCPVPDKQYLLPLRVEALDLRVWR